MFASINYIPAKAKALPHEGALSLVCPSHCGHAFVHNTYLISAAI